MKKILTILLVLACAISMLSIATADAGPFKDIPDDAWYAKSVVNCYDNGIISGTSATTFTPDKAITRAEFAAMFARAYCYAYNYADALYMQDLDGTTDAEVLEYAENATKKAFEDGIYSVDGSHYESVKHFTDVPKDAWYTPYVICMVDAGLMNGTSETTFGPNSLITREQIAAILQRWSEGSGMEKAYANAKADKDHTLEYVAKECGYTTFSKEVVINTDTLKNFKDMDSISAYAKDGVAWAYQSGIMQGVADGVFSPKTNTTRAQAATIFDRIWNDMLVSSAVNTWFAYELD